MKYAPPPSGAIIDLTKSDASSHPIGNHKQLTTKQDALLSLDRRQRGAFWAVEAQARARHDAALSTVRTRVISLGYKVLICE